MRQATHTLLIFTAETNYSKDDLSEIGKFTAKNQTERERIKTKKMNKMFLKAQEEGAMVPVARATVYLVLHG